MNTFSNDVVITAIFTLAVCFCFLVTGAYAAPSADNTEIAFDGNCVNPEDYAVYESFGLTVDNGKLYYDGKLVRCFDDQIPAKNFSVKAIGYYEENGVIDVRAVRKNINGVSGLTGLEVLSQDEFENRVIVDHSITTENVSDCSGTAEVLTHCRVTVKIGLTTV